MAFGFSYTKRPPKVFTSRVPVLAHKTSFFRIFGRFCGGAKGYFRAKTVHKVFTRERFVNTL